MDQANMDTTDNLHEWNNWVVTQPLGSLFQASIWRHFKNQIPGIAKSWVVTIHGGGSTSSDAKSQRNGAIIGGGLIIRHALPRGYSWLECPRGPVWDEKLSPVETEDFFQKFLEKVSAIAEKEKSIFLRIDPPIITKGSANDEPNTENKTEKTYEKITKKLHFKKAHAQAFPEATILVDLTQSEEKILAQMKPKGRYNIKVAEKHGITIEKVPKSDVKIFFNLLKKTGSRDGFAIHDELYYATMLTALGDNAQLFLAYAPDPHHDEQKIPVAGLIATYFGTTATYYYGASSYEHRAMMAPYLLQWEVMRDARHRGYHIYDLFGVAPPHAKNHPWQGVTEFKEKLGGNTIVYSHAQEYIFNKTAFLGLRLAKALKKLF